MNRRSWKRAESRKADALGGRRIPVSGRGRGDTPDVEHPTLSVECKSRKVLPTWLRTGMQQAIAAAREGQVPCVIAHQSGDRYENAYAIVRLRDLEALGLLGNAEVRRPCANVVSCDGPAERAGR
jgi:hypothetical protein